MSVLLAKDDPSTKHSTTSNNIREKSPRLKNNLKLQPNRDSVKIVNEKNAVNLQVCLLIIKSEMDLVLKLYC